MFSWFLTRRDSALLEERGVYLHVDTVVSRAPHLTRRLMAEEVNEWGARQPLHPVSTTPLRDGLLAEISGNGLCTAYSSVAIIGSVALSVHARQDRTINVAGGVLRLKAEATRSKMFGRVDLYKVSLYAPSGVTSVDGLQSRDTPKALRVEVKYKGSLPDRIPREWGRELEPALNSAESQKVRAAYANLRPTDVIQVVYAPGSGTTLSVSGRIVLQAGHDLMAGFLDIWLGQTPVSEEIKDGLRAGLGSVGKSTDAGR